MKYESEYTPNPGVAVEAEPVYRPRVIKMLEGGGLGIDGETITRNRNNEVADALQYDPEVGALVKVDKAREFEFSPQDMIKLGHGYGHVTIQELLGNKAGDFPTSVLEDRSHEQMRKAKKVIEMMLYLYSIQHNDITVRDEGFYTSKAGNFILQKNPESKYSPLELEQQILEDLDESVHLGARDAHEEESIKDKILQLGLISDKERGENKNLIYSYFMTYLKLCFKRDGIEPSSANINDNPDKVKEYCDQFNYLDDLVHHFGQHGGDYPDFLLQPMQENLDYWRAEQ